MLTDVLHLVRNLRRSPTSAVASVLTLALTLGLGTAIYAIVDAVLITPPAFADPDRLVALGEVPLSDAQGRSRTVTYGTFEDWRDRAASWASLEATDGTNLIVTGLGPAERVSAVNVTAGLFALLGVVPARGRAFNAEDVGQPVAIVSDSFWRRALASDPQVIGRQLMLSGLPHTIVGVLPARLRFAFEAEIWRPLRRVTTSAARANVRVGVIARLASNASIADLAQALDTVSRAAAPPARVVAMPLTAARTGDAALAIGLLAGAGAIALLVAFTNLAGLLIVRAIDRQRELALRRALGAQRAEVARQLLLEALSLVIVGAVGGVLLSLWVTPAASRLLQEQFGAIANREVVVNWRVIATMATVACACACLCGLLPAFLASRWNLVDLLRRGSTAAPRELILRRAFVSAVIGLACVLLVSVTLLGRSLLRMLDANPGFDTNGVLAMNMSLPEETYSDTRRVAAFYESLRRALDERFGSSAASTIDELPLTHDRGRTIASYRSSGRESVVRVAAPSYFTVMRIPVVAGRSFDAGDTESDPLRVVLSRALAVSLFGDESPIGRRIRVAALNREVDVIGVVGDVALRSLTDPAVPTMYFAAAQQPSRGSWVVIRSVAPDADVVAAVRAEVARLDAALPVYRIRSMMDVMAASPGVPVRRVLTATFTGFAVLAVVLAAIGLFGVVAHDLSRRRTELAMRIALGANPMRILVATLRHGAVIVGSGLVVGGLLSIWAAQALAGLVVTTTNDDIVATAVPVLTLVVVGASAILPIARRASRTDPLIALRAE